MTETCIVVAFYLTLAAGIVVIPVIVRRVWSWQPVGVSTRRDDAIQFLVTLGFDKSDVTKCVDVTVIASPCADLQAIIDEALERLRE